MVESNRDPVAADRIVNGRQNDKRLREQQMEELLQQRRIRSALNMS